MLVTHYSYDDFAAAADSLTPVQHIDGYASSIWISADQPKT